MRQTTSSYFSLVLCHDTKVPLSQAKYMEASMLTLAGCCITSAIIVRHRPAVGKHKIEGKHCSWIHSSCPNDQCNQL